MGTARETTDSSETKFARHRRLPALVGSGAAFGRAQPCCLSRLNCGADNLWTKFSRHERTRQSSIVASCAKSCAATVHPSSLLRQPDEESREREYKNFVADLRVAVKAAERK